MKRHLCLLVLFGVFPFFGKSQVVINEVSQGPSGSQEYIELVVTTPTSGCASCVDLRGWIIDDNNGWHDSPIGAGQGIASGAMRFSYNAQWSCVLPGTIIVIYNDADPNGSLPASDPGDANGDCIFTVAGNSTLLDRNTTEPNTTALIDYSTITFTNGGSWSTTSMANTDDSYQIIDPNNTSAPYFSIGWGNNNEMQNVYFAGSAAGDVMYNTNSADNNPFNQSNWVVGSATTDQTPGAPNNAANAAWIASMNNSCTPAAGPVVAVDSTVNPTCSGNCNGAAYVTTTGGTSPYTYSWSGGQTTEDVTGLCAGSYNVTVTDADGCIDPIDAAVVITDPPPVVATTSGSVISCSCPCGGAANVFPSGGTTPYSIIWSNGYTDQFQNGLCNGTYNVTVTDAKGCTATGSVTLP